MHLILKIKIAPMLKLNIEIHPYATKGLAPRYLISKTKFRRIRDDKMAELDGRCEACEESDIKMELHEAAAIMDRTYVFGGFFLLCQKCHKTVHCVKSTNRLETVRDNADWTWIWSRHDIKGRSRFGTKAELSKHVHEAFDQVLDFTMADRVSCDYSAAAQYGLDPDVLKAGFESGYDHFASRILFMADSLDWLFEQDRMRAANPEVYVRHPDGKRLKKLKSILRAEYLGHMDYYDANKDVLFGKDSPEREKIILEYAETMRNQIHMPTKK